MRRFMRLARWLIVLLVLGFCTTLGVAWASAAWLTNSGLKRTRFSVAEDGPVRRRAPVLDESWFDLKVHVDEYSRPGMTRRGWRVRGLMISYEWSSIELALRAPITQSDPGDRTMNDLRSTWGELPSVLQWPLKDWTEGMEDARGWPCLAFWCAFDPGPIGRLNWTTRGGILITDPHRSDHGTVRALPYRPIWGGLAINVAAYASAWGLLWLAPSTLRRVLRRRQARCDNCGYDVRELVRCPECGHSVSRAEVTQHVPS